MEPRWHRTAVLELWYRKQGQWPKLCKLEPCNTFSLLAIKVWGFYINLVELCVSATDLGTDTYAQWTLELGGPTTSSHLTSQTKPKMLYTQEASPVWDEINRVLKVSFIREVPFPECLADPAMVKKPNGMWWMSIGYINLNKACPKDEYPLSRIDQIVDSTSRCELLCFLDTYSGYHQISMCIDDEEKLHL